MSTLPTNPKNITHLIWEAYEAKAEKDNRPYLGMSQIGEECARKLWYYFRHVSQPSFDGRVLALFERGQEEEARINKKLRMIGIKVITHDENGEQFGFVGYKGHYRGHMDSCLYGIPEAPKTYHVGEYKTSGDKGFKDLQKNGVDASKPIHWAQMQAYMGHSGMDRALYVAVNKNDDDIYTERVKFDKAAFKELEEKAAYIIDAQEPPERISNDPSWFSCKWCEYHAICHDGKFPAVNCRTCAHSTPIDGGKWSCQRHGEAKATCDDHLFIPYLIGAATDGSDEWIDYGGFINATVSAAEGNAFEGRLVHTSKQLAEAGCTAIARDPEFVGIRKVFDRPISDEEIPF